MICSNGEYVVLRGKRNDKVNIRNGARGTIE